MRDKLEAVYARLYAHLGPQHWWPGETRWEVMVGAVLTQNTSWRNVEQAMSNLKRAGKLDLAAMRRTRAATLARLVRPSGYFNIKARELHALVGFLYQRYAGDPAHMVGGDLETQRQELLNVYGVGPETADSILLYAAEQPVFVVDAYTRRILARLQFVPENVSYDELQQLFMRNLPPDAAYFNEYHALLVALGKKVCTKRAPRCGECPLQAMCPSAICSN